MTRSIQLAACVAALCAGSAQATVIEAVNGDAAPAAPFVLFTYDLGWLYTPAGSFGMNAIETRFGISPRADYNRTVILSIYDRLPSDGGTLLRTASFTPAPDAFVTVTFADLQVIGGTPFFVGFSNVNALGGNITSALNATSLGSAYTSNDGSFSQVTGSGFLTQPILRFSTVPEPSSGQLALFGLCVLTIVITSRTRGIRRPTVALRP